MKVGIAVAIGAALLLSACKGDGPVRIVVGERTVCATDTPTMLALAKACGVGKYPEDCVKSVTEATCPHVTEFWLSDGEKTSAAKPCTEAQRPDIKAKCAEMTGD